jgi:hypothetical protein
MTTEEEMAEVNLGGKILEQTRQDERRREGKMQQDRETAVRVAQISQEQAKKEPKVINQYPSMNQATIVGKPHGPNLNGGEDSNP